MRFLLPALLMLSACDETQVQLEARCTPVLENILNIQNIRDVIRKDFHIMTDDYTGKRMSSAAWQREKYIWLTRENELVMQVDRLYEHAYETGCLK